MTVKALAVGVESLQQTVTLYNVLKRIDFNLDLVKSPSGVTGSNYYDRGFKNKESVYVAMPFAIRDFTINHELPGAVVDPFASNSSVPQPPIMPYATSLTFPIRATA